MNFFTNLQEKRKKIIITLVFSIIFVAGACIFKDYNIYGDEPFHYWASSLYYNFIKTFLTTFNFQNNFFYEINENINNEGYKVWFVYPIFFDLFSEILINIFNIKDENIFYFRHFLTFLFFYISLVYFYLIIEKRFKNYFLSLLSVSILFLTPCIFANSFYNNKDIVFLCFSIISIYYAVNFLNKQTLQNLILFSIFSALLINSRIFGILIVINFFFFYLFDGKLEKKKLIKKFYTISFSLLLISFICFLFWPFLWMSPYENFLDYINWLTNGLADYKINNLYLGQVYNNTNLPFHYLPIWILISIPVSIFILSIFGLYKILLSFLNRVDQVENTNLLFINKNELLDFFIFTYFLLSLFLGIFSGHNHGSWRYFYFIYPLLIFFSIYFISWIKVFNSKLFYFILIIIFFNLSSNLIWITKNHPFQNVFFNSIQKKILKKDFELDYWGNSDIYMLKHILKLNNEKNITVAGTGYVWIKGSFGLLNYKEKSRLIDVDVYEADFIIDRNSPPYFDSKLKSHIDNNYDKYFELIVDGNIINTIYKSKK